MQLQNNNNILSVPLLKMPYLKGLGETIYEKMIEHKEAIAHTDALTGEIETYNKALQKSVCVAAKMHSMGIKPNDIITICSHNNLNGLIALYASFLIGTTPANIDPSLPLADVVYFLKMVRPVMIFVGLEAVMLIENALKETELETKIVVFGKNSVHLQYTDFLKSHAEEERTFKPYVVKNLNDTTVIVFSSSTTGTPKGVCLTHMGVLGQIHQAGDVIVRGSTIMSLSNLSQLDSVLHIISSVLQGLNILVFPKCNEKAMIWDLIENYKINKMYTSPRDLIDVCANRRSTQVNTTSLLSISLTGDSVLPQYIRLFRTCFPNTLITSNYGQLELSGVTLSFKSVVTLEEKRLLLERPLSVGRPLPSFSYKVVDLETNQVLGPNQEGELLIKPEFKINGYYNVDSSFIWDADGFIRTGDIAYYDRDYCFYVVDTVKDILKYQMRDISPTTIEAVFYKHPAVERCTVTSKHDPIDGDLLFGLVVLKESSKGKITEEELKEFVNDQVGEYKKLHGGIKFVNDIPFLVTNKLGRRKLKRLLEHGEI